MVYLIFDLDRTVFVGVLKGNSCEIDDVRRKHEIDPSHEFKPISTIGTLSNGTVEIQANLFLINPRELSDLIQAVSNKGGEVLILTAGLWQDSIREVLADYLDLSDKAAEMLRRCHFHSPITDTAFIEASCGDIQYMLKSERLAHIMRHKPALTGKHFIVLDDEEEHIESFQGQAFIETVLATPDLPTKRYYQQALRCVNELSRANRLTQAPSVLFQPEMKRAREENKENTPNKRSRIGNQ